jgi:hypothetical protein
MIRIIFCSGFWLTVAIFVALGYALGADCASAVNCSQEPQAAASSVRPDEGGNHESELRAVESEPTWHGCVARPLYPPHQPPLPQ